MSSLHISRFSKFPTVKYCLLRDHIVLEIIHAPLELIQRANSFFRSYVLSKATAARFASCVAEVKSKKSETKIANYLGINHASPKRKEHYQITTR